ncbi:putative leucine-rich repeat receptor-like protein kinase [Arachis hypogaea]|nr:putative leucine-rich repeat receptor-like protein kinase [Arachis hypogaea]
MSKGYSVIVLLLLFLSLILCTAEGLNAEGQILLDLKNGFHDKNNLLRNWNPADETPCEWLGVNCSYYEYNNSKSPVVMSLDLSSMGLSGILNGSSIGGLTHLTYLNLSHNKLSGKIPKEIGDCLNLEYLYLNNNQFQGPIPDELGNLSRLRSLNICNNKLNGYHWEAQESCDFQSRGNNITGSLPKEISGCASLMYLGLAQNDISGELPSEIGMLQNLTELILWDNQLSGPIPKEIGNLTNLEILALYWNDLVGPIPPEIGNLKSLKELLVGYIPSELSKIRGLRLLFLFENHLIGVIPDELSSLRNLSRLDLSMNGLTGSIPSGFQYLTNMSQLQLFDNKLSGVIPQELGLHSPLWVVDFSDNNLTGTIPPHLCWNSHLMLLNLQSNRFYGNIPRGILKCKSLAQMLVVGNMLTGGFPSELCKLPNFIAIELNENKFSGPIPPLVTFNVSSNHFTGTIPSEIFRCQKLQRLDLSNNKFIGSLPNNIGTLEHLEILKLSGNELSGKIPEEIGNLSHLNWLQMDGNLFSDEIPAQLGRLSTLQIGMDLSYNNLSGRIPSQLGNLNMLEYIYLNNNHLDGEIPSSFDQLSSLLGCNFSYNNLSGPIPSDKIFQNMAASSFLGGNNDLCGRPLNECNSDLSSRGFPPVRHDDSRRAKIVMIAAATVGSGSLWDGLQAVMKSGKTIAVKKLASNREGNNIENSFRAEILTLGKIRHRNIVKLYGFCYHQGSNLLLYEYMERGSLGEVLHGSATNLEWPIRFMIALGAAEAKVIDMPQSKSMSAVAGSYGYIAPGRAPVQPLEQGGDLVTWVRTHIRSHNNVLTQGILDNRIDLEEQVTVNHMLTVLKIALLCTSMSPSERPSMREVVLMLIESNEREGNLTLTRTNHDLPSKDATH